MEFGSFKWNLSVLQYNWFCFCICQQLYQCTTVTWRKYWPRFSSGSLSWIWHNGASDCPSIILCSGSESVEELAAWPWNTHPLESLITSILVIWMGLCGIWTSISFHVIICMPQIYRKLTILKHFFCANYFLTHFILPTFYHSSAHYGHLPILHYFGCWKKPDI